MNWVDVKWQRFFLCKAFVTFVTLMVGSFSDLCPEWNEKSHSRNDHFFAQFLKTLLILLVLWPFFKKDSRIASFVESIHSKLTVLEVFQSSKNKYFSAKKDMPEWRWYGAGMVILPLRNGNGNAFLLFEVGMGMGIHSGWAGSEWEWEYSKNSLNGHKSVPLWIALTWVLTEVLKSFYLIFALILVCKHHFDCIFCWNIF